MFRKFTHITISFLLLTITAGYSISKHYCGNTLVSVSILQKAEPCCDMQGKEGCCHNETESFQLDENYVISSGLENDLIKSLDLFVLNYIVLDSVFFIEISTNFVTSESPPPIKTQSKLARLQTYLC